MLIDGIVVPSTAKAKINPTPLEDTDGANKADETGAVPTGQLPPLNYVPLSTKASANGVATLDADGKIPTDQLPGLAISDTYVAATEAEMLAIGAQRGDVCVRSDVHKSYILQGQDPTQLSGWLELIGDTYTRTQIDSKISTATTTQYHGTPYDIATAVINKPSGTAKVLRFVAPRLFTIPTNAVGSLFRAGTVSLANATFLVYKNSDQIGTITFTAGVANATCVLTETIFTAGDMLTITAPPVQDQKLADLVFTIVAGL